MKIIFIKSTNDYEVTIFEDEFKADYKTWETLKNDGCLTSKEGRLLEGEALEFDEIDLNFVKFIKNKVIYYDNSKHTNFYVVKEKYENKVVKMICVESCGTCPYYSQFELGGFRCNKLNKTIQSNYVITDIYDECPLDDVEIIDD